MNKQSGFILPPLGISTYAIIGLSLLCGVLSITIKVQSSRLETVKVEYAAFASGVEQIGKLAVSANKLKETEDQLKKEQADNENTNTHTRIADLSRRLRDERSRGSYLPPAVPGSASPDKACFGRPDLERAIQQLDGNIQKLIDEGDQDRIDLNTAKAWNKLRENIKAKE